MRGWAWITGNPLSFIAFPSFSWFHLFLVSRVEAVFSSGWMFLTECCKGKTSVGRALLGSEDVDIVFL